MLNCVVFKRFLLKVQLEILSFPSFRSIWHLRLKLFRRATSGRPTRLDSPDSTWHRTLFLQTSRTRPRNSLAQWTFASGPLSPPTLTLTLDAGKRVWRGEKGRFPSFDFHSHARPSPLSRNEKKNIIGMGIGSPKTDLHISPFPSLMHMMQECGNLGEPERKKLGAWKKRKVPETIFTGKLALVKSRDFGFGTRIKSKDYPG